MYLKTDIINAYFDGIVMKSHKTPGAFQELILDQTAIKGWTDGVTIRRDSTPRLVTNGDFYEPAKLGSRLIQLTGMAVTISPADLIALRDMFIGFGADTGYRWFSVQTETHRRFALVGVEGTPQWSQVTDTTANWKLDLYAPDPYIYGDEQIITIGQSVDSPGGLALPLRYPLNYNAAPSSMTVIRNQGNVDSWPVFRVNGTYHNGFEIFDNRNSRVTYKGVVTPQAPVYIDMGKGTATQTGVDKTVLVTNRQWFSVGRDETVRPEIKGILGGTGWCDVYFRDTFI